MGEIGNAIIQADELYDYEASMSRPSRSGPKDGDQRRPISGQRPAGF